MVRNVIVASGNTLSEFPNAVNAENYRVAAGDVYDGTGFFRDGKALEPASAAAYEMQAALKALGVQIKERNDLFEQAQALRTATQELAQNAPDEVVAAQPLALYDEWSAEGAEYAAGDVRQYGGLLYRCVTAHTSQASWTPPDAPSLWTRIADPAQEWPEWIAPTGAHNAYAAGAKVSHNGRRWTSDVDGNTWEPGVYGWTEVEA